MVPKNITVNTTLSKKHPWLLLRPGGPTRDPPRARLRQMPQKKNVPPRGEAKTSPPPESWPRAWVGITPWSQQVPSMSPPRPRRAAPPWPGGRSRVSLRQHEEIPAGSGWARKAGLLLHSLLLPPPVTNVPPRAGLGRVLQLGAGGLRRGHLR